VYLYIAIGVNTAHKFNETFFPRNINRRPKPANVDLELENCIYLLQHWRYPRNLQYNNIIVTVHIYIAVSLEAVHEEVYYNL